MRPLGGPPEFSEGDVVGHVETLFLELEGTVPDCVKDAARTATADEKGRKNKCTKDRNNGGTHAATAANAGCRRSHRGPRWGSSWGAACVSPTKRLCHPGRKICVLGGEESAVPSGGQVGATDGAERSSSLMGSSRNWLTRPQDQTCRPNRARPAKYTSYQPIRTKWPH